METQDDHRRHWAGGWEKRARAAGGKMRFYIEIVYYRLSPLALRFVQCAASWVGRPRPNTLRQPATHDNAKSKKNGRPRNQTHTPHCELNTLKKTKTEKGLVT